MHRYTSHSFALSVPYFLLGLAVKGVDKCGANVYKNKVFGIGGALFIDRLIQVNPQMDTDLFSQMVPQMDPQIDTDLFSQINTDYLCESV